MPSCSGPARGPQRVSMRGGDGVPWPAAGADFFIFSFLRLVSWEFRYTCGHAITPCDSLPALLTVPCCTIDHLHSSRPKYPALSDDLIVRPVGGVLPRVHASGAMRVASDWLLALSRLCLHSLARMGSQEGPRTFSGQRRCLSLGPANLVFSCHQCGTSAASRHRQL